MIYACQKQTAGQIHLLHHLIYPRYPYASLVSVSSVKDFNDLKIRIYFINKFLYLLCDEEEEYLSIVKDRVVHLLGLIGSLIAYIAIGLSIYLSPWFKWESNALSDLGHAQRSEVAPIFNFGLLVSGFIIAIYSVKSLSKYAKYTSISLTFSALMLQTVATFDEIYSNLHFLVSVLFFVSIGFSCIIYSIEKKSILAALAFTVGLLSWMLYWAGLYKAGVAVPEVISAVAATLCIIQSTLKILNIYGNKSANMRDHTGSASHQ